MQLDYGLPPCRARSRKPWLELFRIRKPCRLTHTEGRHAHTEQSTQTGRSSFTSVSSKDIGKPILKRCDVGGAGEHLAGKRVLIVGAGPAGCCAAMYMGRLGASVDVYEARPDEDLATPSARSYIIVLQERALHALARAGFDVCIDDSNRMLGSVSISARGKVRAIASPGDSAGFSRAQLARALKDAACEQHPARLAFHFGWRCVGGDLDARKLTFKHAQDGTLRTVTYDFLVGADGQNSRVRDLLEDQVPGFSVDRQSSGRQYKTFSDLAGGAELEPTEWRAEHTGRSILLWSSAVEGYTLSANRRPNGSFAGNFSAVDGKFEELEGVAAYRAVLDAAFTGVPDGWSQQIAEQVAAQPATPFPQTIKTSQLHGPRAALIGDAAHCVTPILGQGANAALEDCGLLADVVATVSGDLQRVGPEFERRRGADARSLVDINRYFLWATGLGPLALLAFAPLAVHAAVGSLLGLLPGVQGPAFLRIARGVRYSEVVRGVLRDCALFLVGIACLVFQVGRRAAGA